MSFKTNITQQLLNDISYLDAFSGSNGMLSSKGVSMTSDPTDKTIVEFLSCLGECRKRIEDNEESKIIIKKVYDSLLPYFGRIKFKELTQTSQSPSQPEESFEELYDRLHSLIGLEKVKSAVDDLISYHKIQSLRKQSGLKTPNRTLHLAFTGNPGTGKTTVARILGKMYKELGLLSKGHFMEVSRTDLIAGYQGQTAIKVKKVIEEAKGGVLFIDEAYSLTENDHSDSYGKECLTELTKALEDYRDDLVVIVAGYTDLMQAFFESNPGLKSRFNTFIEFPDYQSTELMEIFLKMCQQDDYTVSEEAKSAVSEVIDQERSRINDKFANGRYVRNLYEDTIMNHARRLYNSPSIKQEELSTLRVDDISPDCSVAQE